MATSQSVVPHAQFVGLAAVPSEWEHAPKRHRLASAKQKSPVVAASQSTVPQAQSAPLATVPSVVAQMGTALHELNEEVQKSPVADVQASEAPQTQGAGLAVAPSPWAQAGPVKAAHRHWSLEVHGPVLLPAILIFRAPPSK